MNVLVILPALLLLVAAHAHGEIGGEQRPEWCEPPHPAAVRQAGEPVDQAEIQAGEFSGLTGAPVRFSEGVRLLQFDQLLETEELVYDLETGRVDIPVWLRYSDSLIELEALGAWYETRESRGRFEQVVYRLVGHDGSGTASVVELVEPGQARLETFDFTTCNPPSPDWQLKAGDVRLDLDAGVGTARHARLEFKGVPLLYTPWMSFPLTTERKTGFLYPRIGYSGSDGLDLSVPWYWNIAPDRDATLTGRWIARRGAMALTEYRFLTDRQRGQLDFEILPDDRRTGSTRHFGQFDWRARLAPRWTARADLRRASDDDYFIDLGSDLADSSVQFLRSSINLASRGDYWLLEVMADDFQVLDDTVAPEREPYRRLPRARLLADRPLAGPLSLVLDSELVHFQRDVGVTGTRLDLYPSLGYRLMRPGWFLNPRLGVRSTHYQLDGAETGSLSRTLPIASIDAGLVFERPAAGARTQTLEPRIFYLYVPFRDQDRIPDFDTGELTFGFSQLFHFNRFSGPDRQADANQVALALTSRLIDDARGHSVLGGSVGQIFHFSDQHVQLPGEVPSDSRRSATVAEMFWRPADRLALSAGLQWDSQLRETQVAQLGLSYRGQQARQVALGYRFRRDRVDQADVRFRHPVNERLRLIGRLTWSFEDDEALEALAGIEYESCCWALRLTARDHVRDRDGDSRTAVFLELQLRGLGSLGRPPYDLFGLQP